MEMADSRRIQALQEEANRLRVHCIRMTTKAGSGHPTTCLSAAEIAACLFFEVMRYDPKDPQGAMNDRFVLSKGHAAPLLYAALAEAGAFPVEHLMTLRTLESDLEGHPTPRFPWAYVATGSLGQGLSVGAGMALCWKYLDEVDRRAYVLLGDGETAEGAVWESAALAAHYKLNNLTAVVDVNRLGQSQATMYGHDTEVYVRKFEAFGWRTVTVDGHDCAALLKAFQAAQAGDGRPTAVIAQTIKGKGVPFAEDKNGFHGKAFSEEEADRAIEEIGAPDERPPFEIKMPAESRRPEPPAEVELDPPSYNLGDMVATRQSYGSALAKLGSADPRIVALDGDVKNSTFSQVFAKAHPKRFFECFIAEQNMVGAAMGLATCGKIPFVSSFGAFLTRACDQIRMAGVSKANVKFCGSHAGVSIGEDGASQMALEDLAIFRAIPGSVVLYPCDAVSAERLVVEASRHTGPAFIRTSRPKTPVIYGTEEQFPLGGLKVLRQSESDRICLAGAGVTVHEALKAHDMLKEEGINVRVIDLYSVKPIAVDELADNASASGSRILVAEDHYPEGGIGEAVAAALSGKGITVYGAAVTSVPGSDKGAVLLDSQGLSAGRLAEKIKEILAEGD
jgi:transketolase